MNIQLFLFITLASFATAQLDRGCRVCQAGCQTIPREDGGCPACICNGVVKSDCPIVQFCPPTCRRELDADGCSSCACGQPRCPAVASCAAGCSQTTGTDGCLRCDCTVRTNNNNVCPAVPSCIKGCIEIREGESCFSCTCNSPNVNGFGVNGVNGFGANGFGVNGVNGFGPNGVGGFGVNGVGGFGLNGVGPIGLDGNRCPAGCRLGISRLTGSSQCYCGNDASVCPAVPLCLGRCLFRQTADSCCRCNCPEVSAAAVAGRRVPLGGVVPTALIPGRVIPARVPAARFPGRLPGRFGPTARFPGAGFGFQGIPRSPGSFRGPFGPFRQVSVNPVNPLPTRTPSAVTPATPVEPLSPGSGTRVGGQVPDL